MKDEYFLDTDEAAHYIGYKRSTLENWRQQSKGPKYSKPAGKILYKKTDLDKWVRK